MSTETTQTASRVLMIRPTGFGRDEQAAQTNRFMKEPAETLSCINQRAIEEFNALSQALSNAGVEVLIFEDELGLPDSVFPNNWVSFHQPIEDGERENPLLVTYPMLAQSRRKERRNVILDAIAGFTRCEPDHYDLSELEESDEFLEGTGSLVLDRTSNIAYACLSGRTSQDALDAWADMTGYQTVMFHSADLDGNPIYHTNVMLSIGEKICVVCFESITDPDEYERVENSLRASGRELITISLDQVSHYCGNILELQSREGNHLFAMSQEAFEHFTDAQKARLQAFGQIVHVPIPTIEYIAGGSVRCMIAELGISS
ncbi:MAG: arginine deiminase-related protein [Phycisphaerales bacterium]|nr:arginine deiminase-related protein [Phycisphaerales bacterium]